MRTHVIFQNLSVLRQSGFTLIELMIVIAILGILAAVGLPAYQDYMVRAKISEALLVGAALKNEITETYLTDGLQQGISLLASDIASRGLSSKYLQGVVVSSGSGMISLSIHNTGSTAANGMTLNLFPNTLSHGVHANLADPAPPNVIVDWACLSTTGERARSLGFVGEVLGTLPARFAPSECR